MSEEILPFAHVQDEAGWLAFSNEIYTNIYYLLMLEILNNIKNIYTNLKGRVKSQYLLIIQKFMLKVIPHNKNALFHPPSCNGY